MKRFCIPSLLIALLLSACATTGSEAGLTLQDAIEQTGEKIAGELPKGSRVAIVAFESENDNLSDYIMEELTGALFDRGIEVADRQNLEYVYKELNFQMSGDVSDETAKSIGKFLAADMVITGQLTHLGSTYRYRTSAISVETAVRASVTRFTVRNDRETQSMVAALSNQQTTVRAAKYGVSADVTPQTAGTFIDRGILFASRGDYEMAIADFTEALKLEPNLAAAYILRGRALYASASKVISIGDSFSSIVTVTITGQVSVEQTKLYEQAITDFSQALKLEPNNAKIYVARGNVYSDKGDYDKGIADFNQAIQLEPDYAQAFYGRGITYYIKRDYDLAIMDYTQVIHLSSNDADAYYGRGSAYYMKRDYEKAIADFEAALQIDPNYSYAKTGLENARKARGR